MSNRIFMDCVKKRKKKHLMIVLSEIQIYWIQIEAFYTSCMVELSKERSNK
jgi:hypothetical protein